MAKGVELVKQYSQEISREEDVDGWRWYKGPDGRKYASVTNILSCIQHSRLQNWWKKHGPKAIEKKTKRARDLGSADHDALETYIRRGEVTQGHEDFIQAWSGFALEEGIIPIHSELMVFSPTLGVAGTIDIVGTIKGKPSIMDLKTGRFFGVKAGWQIAAYKYLFEELTAQAGFGMAGIHSRRVDSPAITNPQEKFDIKLFQYVHMEFCLRRFLCVFEAWKGLYFSKLKQMEWPWLHSYSAEEKFRERTIS